MVKISNNTALEELIRPLKDDIEQYSQNMDLYADIMLSLSIKRSETAQNGSEGNLRQELNFVLQDTRHYMDRKGRHFDIVKGSGIYVPSEQRICEIQFIRPEELESRQYDMSRLVLRKDEVWGNVYADHNSVRAAFSKAMRLIEHLESQEIDLKKAVPDAEMDFKELASVSVACFGTYFHRFRHFEHEDMEEHDNYNTYKRKQEFSNLAFLPESTIVVKTDEC